MTDGTDKGESDVSSEVGGRGKVQGASRQSNFRGQAGRWNNVQGRATTDIMQGVDASSVMESEC